jgi:serine/threonine-protein kinase
MSPTPVSPVGATYAPPRVAPGSLVLTAGQVVSGRFEVVSLLGQGSMGQVFLARDQVMGRSVAVKVLRPELGRDASFLQRFFAEAQVVASLSTNPNVVTLFDTGMLSEEQPFLVMEYLPGRSMRALLAELTTRPPRSWVVSTGCQITSALADAHEKGVVHRDLKPENVMELESRTQPFLVKVLDFGIAASFDADPDGATLAGAILGTPPYMSPEVISGEGASAASDVYALGIMLYEASAGRHPYAARNNGEWFRAHVLSPIIPLGPQLADGRYPDRFVKLVESMLEKSPGARPTAKDVLRELLRAEEEIAEQKYASRPRTGR